LRPLYIAREPPEIGDKVFVLGSPVGGFGTWTEGRMSLSDKRVKVFMGPSGIIDMGFTQYSVPSYKGNSGSPIMNERGEVVGIVSSGYPNYPFITLSPKHKKLVEFLGVD
jgi:S1-C subfamily serine protease